MMGYGQGNQTTGGIHFRLRARALVVEDKKTLNKVAYVNLDIALSTLLIKNKVVAELEKTLPGVYGHENLLITATHTHSGPGGYSWYTVYDITTWGWHEENVNTIVSGICNAVLTAHKTKVSASLQIHQGTLEAPLTNINRSPAAYNNNPASERAKYKYDVEKQTITLKASAEDGSPIAALNWFPVHGTSMNNWNNLISGDNKGYAMYLFERHFNGNSTLPGFGKFVAMFSNANEGDVTPNTRGAFCFDGTPCEMVHSTCNGTTQACRSYGPGSNVDIYGFESAKIIGEQQFVKALEQFNKANEALEGGVNFVHTYKDMSKIVVTPKFTGLSQNVTTCSGAIGDSFAAGTIDGPGDFDFVQGSNSTKTNEFWNAITHFLIPPGPEDEKCQYPKPILLAGGRTQEPTPWTPSILPLQMIKIGHLYIIAVPSEFTTMAGRRLKETIREVLLANGAPSNLIVTISGLSNEYSQYTATPEEYVIQRYEGASTLFGPHQLDAYRQEYSELAAALQTGKDVAPGPTPVDYTDKLFCIQPGVILDDGPIGTVLTQPLASYKRGQQVYVQFQSANPRNNHRTQDTFLSVDLQQADGSWKVVFVDGHWETKFHWARKTSILLGESVATITWDIPEWAVPGTYRITHYGDKKGFLEKVTPFTGVTNTFKVL
eukprot:TRINITY_DN14227_c0_g1_i1.p1 TRINITY_DN14227_c0_g1~~TRINITY_DN14227_c0_g1_i1.p1  ORF type:complete len:717 (+),score=195.04 TRINITY_DN14227_c0_g1_i1:170-2152(+)